MIRRHNHTIRAEAAVMRAEKALDKAKAAHEAACRVLAEAEENLRLARDELAGQRRLDEQGCCLH